MNKPNILTSSSEPARKKLTFSPTATTNTGKSKSMNAIDLNRAKHPGTAYRKTGHSHPNFKKNSPDEEYINTDLWTTVQDESNAKREKRGENPLYGKWSIENAGNPRPKITLCDQFGRCITTAIILGVGGKLLGFYGGKTKSKRQKKNKTKSKRK